MLQADFVKFCFGVALLVTVATAWIRRSMEKQSAPARKTDERLRGFQRTYLVVYLAAMMADWLQGPFVYALYDAYSFTQQDNAMLFTVGFGSSAVCGTVIGSMADRRGRRKFAALYCVLYAVSCLTKHVRNFKVLLLGRLTGGIATSLLFSVFDSWLVSEHSRRDFDAELLGNTFSVAVFWNSVVAIVAGALGQIVVDMKELTPVGSFAGDSDVFVGGLCGPFDVAIVFLMFALAAMFATWSENYGQKQTKSSEGSVTDTLTIALHVIRQHPQVFHCGVVCSLFEASMYIFVFMWTPALTQEGEPKPPYGHIFATFMVMAMLGSQAFSYLSVGRPIELVGVGLLLVAAGCHSVPVLVSNATVRFLSFLIFEMCVGVYFPMMGTLKGMIVPEESRSAIYNLYRLPLNVIVVGALVAKVELSVAFSLTTFLLLVAVVFQLQLLASRRRSAGSSAQYRQVGSNIDTEFGLDEDHLGDEVPAASTEMPNVIGNMS